MQILHFIGEQNIGGEKYAMAVDLESKNQSPKPILRVSRNIYDLLPQDAVWCDKSGNTIRLEDLAPTHVDNILRMIDKRNPFIILMGYSMQLHRDWHMAGPHGDAAQDAFDEWDCGMSEAIENDPKAWLESMPLIKRLRDLQKQYWEPSKEKVNFL